MVNSLNKKPYNEKEQEIYNLAYHRGINKGKADAIDELFSFVDNADMDSTYIYLEFDKEKLNPPFMKMREEVKEWLKEQLKERNNVQM